MNLGQIVQSVQRQFGDESGAQITRSDIVRWANDAQVDINRKTEVLQIHSETDAIKGDGSYNLPTDFVRIRRVTYNQIVLTRVELEAVDQMTRSHELENNSNPSMFYVWGTKLWIYPRPSKTGVGNLDIFYVKAPDPLVNDQDIPEIPSTMHEDIVRYCLGRAKELDEEDAKAQEVMADYEARVSLSRDETHSPEINSYPSVRDIEGGYEYGPVAGGSWW